MEVGAPIVLASENEMVHCNIMFPTPAFASEASAPAARVGSPPVDPRRASIELSGVLRTEFQEIAGAITQVAALRLGNVLRGLFTLTRCRSPQDVVAARAAILCEDIDLMQGLYERTGQIVADAAGGAVRAIAPRL